MDCTAASVVGRHGADVASTWRTARLPKESEEGLRRPSHSRLGRSLSLESELASRPLRGSPPTRRTSSLLCSPFGDFLSSRLD